MQNSTRDGAIQRVSQSPIEIQLGSSENSCIIAKRHMLADAAAEAEHTFLFNQLLRLGRSVFRHDL